MQDGRWVEVSPSQFDHEKEGLDLVKALLPDAPPFRAWSNFEFRDSRGRWHEVDLLVLARDTLYLIELKYYSGTLRGNDHVWTRGGYRSEDSPLLLTRRKAQYFSSLLKDRLAEHVGQNPRELRGVIPYVQELVFLHHPSLACELPASSALGLYGLDGKEAHSHLPGISERLLAPPQHDPVTEQKSLLIRDLMTKIGLAPRRQRELGSWVIDEQPLGDGEGWQDWPAFHHVDTERHARIRFYLPKPGASTTEEHARVRAVEHEYRLLARLRHDGLQVPADVVKDKEMGIGLVFDQPKAFTRLDLWLADNATTLSLDGQLELLSQVAETVQYAHRHRVVHRVLNPRAVAVREKGGALLPLVTDWDCAGVLPANAETGVTRLSAGPLSLMAGALTEQARLFAAPEGGAATDPARVDVFGLGALAFYLLTGGTMPATERGELMDRLRRDRGLDLAADMPQVPSALRQLVLDATHPSPAERLATVTDFLDRLEDTRTVLVSAEEVADPLDAGPGAELGDGRFVYQRRLGAGSTAVGILVTDRKAGDAQRVLKVAKDDEAALRLHAEAQVLGKLNDPRIVQLSSEEVVAGRAALVLQYAGRTTLSEELAAKGGRLSIDQLERWGEDLLGAVMALERAGVTHRDIKPSNLGVWSSSQRADTHLVMFDFSMAGVDPRNIEAGTPPYLDPFLGQGGRAQYDSAAERYGAAVVLFEMATGDAPQYGPDPQANPATVDDDVTVVPERFDPAVADALTQFFVGALSRRVELRSDTAEDMLRAWRAVFTELDEKPVPVDTAGTAEQATTATNLTAAGLTARAVSALGTLQVTTVGELLALDSTKLNRLLAKEARGTRTEIRDRYREWAKRLGRQQRTARGQALLGLDEAVAILLAAVGKGRAGTRRAAAALLLGTTSGLDAFASGHELADVLGKTHQRGHQLIKELQSDWAENPATRELLDEIIESAQQVLADSGGVAAISTLTAEIRGRLPQPPADDSDAAAPALAERAAAGLLRVAFDRLTEHEAVEGAKRLLRRRHDGRLALVATDELLLAAAESAARRADELVTTADVVVASPTAAREVRAAFTATYRNAAGPQAQLPLPPDARLVRLAAAVSRRAAVSGRGELHARSLGPSEALRLALAGLSQAESLAASEVRARVAARFPELDRLPGRPALDTMIDRAGIGLRWLDGAYRYPDATPPSATSLHTRAVTHTGGASPGRTGDASSVAAAAQSGFLQESLRENGFVTVGVPVRRPGDHLQVARGLVESFDGQLVDVTGRIIDAMHAFTRQQGIGWERVRNADAAAEGTKDARGLRAVLDRVLPQVIADLEAEVFVSAASEATQADKQPRPLILTELSPLARYGCLDVLARLSDLSAPRLRPVWAVVPQMRGQTGAVVDGKPIQLGVPGGQFVMWTASDLADADVERVR
ncbi:BREX system serine/threonine kinase PglW [Rhodococcus sp. BP-252]|uniref:BREX system serine/threonine kinase PglW n=1 Tax=unclassified Rhodococcus (in: high G+C Gram-positive bacteria) TaxID=192944 RepID=UPI001C9A4A72|nr:MULTISPECIES: BREX system serine/threonine kinase PglW [unclassified Rhodococcus (in: high G+C Gram-positive bacteria)]MBY6413366.1 BREX system serine/threonine kinase PglW [Rhodococcus sp. BP-320]MBY6418030.1 BREX system serine/threonine kinase PglW [Rhodococcus sp. BP-321]MBY6422280.1 BREX system serine/threonine kinase PglW [Rhodococcus sp. BP-324]MBY6428079.1 BREX system serine/threonine kinase PglW [Rhodococcus sp. BP-323]MBY6433287.1 BREX system serine/threonine kinase PglW [Rhodococc